MSSRMQTFTAVAEIMSAVAVVVTLVVLVVSVRDNTAAIRAAAAASSRDSMASMNDLMLTMDDDDLALFLRTSDSDSSSLKDFSDLEQFKLLNQQRSFFRRAEAQYFRYRNGLLDEDAWQTTLHRVWANIQSPADGELWQEDKYRVYTAGFVEAVDAYRPESRQ